MKRLIAIDRERKYLLYNPDNRRWRSKADYVDILMLAKQGKTIREISQALKCSDGSVRHAKKVYLKYL